MSKRRVRGRLKSLSHTGHRQAKKLHNEKTNRKGKLWAKGHVAKEKVDVANRRAKREADRARRRRLERQGVIVAGDE